MAEAYPNQLTEVHLLKVHLLREKQQRLQAESANLQMGQRALDSQYQQLQRENKAMADELNSAYGLKPEDQVSPEGAIVRAPPKPEPGDAPPV